MSDLFRFAYRASKHSSPFSKLSSFIFCYARKLHMQSSQVTVNFRNMTANVFMIEIGEGTLMAPEF